METCKLLKMPALSDDLNFTSWKVHNNLAISLIKNPIFTQLNLLTFDPPFNKMALNYFISYVHHYEPCQKYVRTNTASSLQQGGYCQGVQRVCDTVIYTHTILQLYTAPSEWVAWLVNQSWKWWAILTVCEVSGCLVGFCCLW